MVYSNSNADEIASIYVEAVLSLDKLNKQIAEIQKTKYTLDVAVNDKRLSDLNKHLNLKVKHLDETIKHFKSNPVIVSVDDSQLVQLNRGLTDLKQLSKQNFSLHFDTSEIIREIKNIKKEIQAQRFRIGIDTNNLQQQIQTALSNNNKISLNLRVKEREGDKYNFREVTTAIKSVEKAVRENKKSVLGTVLTGSFETFGNVITTSFIRSLKKDLNIDVNAITRPITKFIGKPLSKVTPQAVQDFEDSVVSALEDLFVFNNKAGFQDKLKSAFKPAVEELKESVLEAISPAVYTIAQPFRIRKRVLLAQSMQAAEKQAESIKIDEKQIKQIEKAKSISIITGGIDFDKGRNTQFAENLVKRVLPGSYSVPVVNDWSNQEATLGELYKLTRSLGLSNKPMPLDKLLQVAVEKGFNPDAIKMAASAMAYRKNFPDKPINLLGTSGGSYIVEEALSILQRAGIENVKGVGITAPFLGLTATAKPGSFTANIGDLDPLFVAMFGGRGVADRKSYAYQKTLQELPLPTLLPGLFDPNKSPFNRIVPNAGVGHALLPFLANETFQTNLYSHLGGTIDPIKPEYTGIAGIRNLDTLRIINNERNTIPRTLAAVFRDPQTLRQIEKFGFTGSEGYTFAVPQKPEWRRDYDFRSMMAGLEKKGSKATGEVKQIYEEYNQFLKNMEAGLVEFLESGAKVKTKLLQTLNDAIEFYPELVEIQKRVISISQEYTRLLELSKSPQPDSRTARERYKDERRLQRLQTQFPTGFDFRSTKEMSYVLEVKQMTASYREVYKQFKEAIKEGNKELAINLGTELLKNADKYRTRIAELTNLSGQSGKIGTLSANQLASAKGEISKKEKEVLRQFSKLKIDTTSIRKQGEEIGSLLQAGEKKGLEKGGKETVETAKELSYKVIDTVKDIYGIESPSRVFMHIGEMLAEGLNIGLNNFNSIDWNKILTEPINFAKDSIKELFSGFSSNSSQSLNNLIANFSKLGAAITTVVVAGRPFLDFVISSINVATEMEGITRGLTFATGGGSRSQFAIETLTKQARELRLNLRDVLEGSNKFLSSTEGTKLEGDIGVGVLQNFNQLLAVRAISREKQFRAIEALSQIISKGGNIQAEEIRGQLAEAIPGATGIYARALGMTPQQFSKAMKSGISSDTLINFSQQAKIEATVGINEAINTAQASITNLDNAVLQLQQNVGKIFLPLQKISFDSTAKAIDFISNNLGLISNAITALAIFLTKPIWMPFLKYQYQALINFDLMAAKAKLAGFSIQNVFNSLKPAIGQFLLIEGVLSIIDQLKIAFSDLSGEVGKFADQSRKGLEEYKRLTTEIKTGQKQATLPTNFLEGFANYWKNNFTAILNPFDNSETEYVKKPLDILKRNKNLLEDSKYSIKIGYSNETKKYIADIQRIDKEIADIQAKRRAAIQLNPKDTLAIKDLQKQETELINTRFKILEPIATQQANIETQIKGLKVAQEALDELRKSGNIYQHQYDEQSAAIKKQLKSLEELQNNLTKAVGSTANAFALMKKEIEESSYNFEDLKSSIEAAGFLNLRNLSVDSINNRITPGTTQFLRGFYGINQQAEQIQAKQQYINEFRSTILNENFQRVLNNFGINESTGINKINYLAQSADDNDKFILEEFAKFQEAKKDLEQAKTQLAQSQEDFINQLREQSKQIADYYIQSERELIKSNLEIKKIVNNSGITKQQNRIKDALINGYDNIFTQFADNLIANLEILKEISDINTQARLLDNTFAIEDTIKEGLNLSRTTPGIELPDIETFTQAIESGVTSAKELDDIFNQLTTTIDYNVEFANNLNQSIMSTQDTTDLTVDSFYKLNESIGLSNTNLQTTNDFINNANSSLEAINNQTTEFNKGMSSVDNILENITNSFIGIFDWISKITEQTFKWLDSIISNQNIFGIFGGGQQPEVNESGLRINQKYSIVESVGRANQIVKTYEDLEKHHPSRGREPGRSYRIVEGRLEEVSSENPNLVKKDFILIDSKGNQRVDFPSPISGYAKVSPGIGGVSLYSEPGGRGQLLGRALHLENILVRDDQRVNYGQIIGKQGGAGGYPIHAHVELSPDSFRRYIQDLQDGTFEAINRGIKKSINSNPISNLPSIQPNPEKINNLTRFLHIIGWGESNLQYKTKGRPQGYFQFIPETAEAARKRTGLNPTSPNPQLAARATAAWIRSEHPQAYKAILAGDFKTAYYLLGQKRLEWTSLPGSRESNWGKNSTFSLQTLKDFESGNFRPIFNVKEEPLPSSSPIQSVYSGGIFNPSQMQNFINQGTSNRIQALQQQRQQIELDQQRQNEAKRKDFLRKQEQNLRLLRNSRRDTTTQMINSSRQVEDLANSVNPIKSPNEIFNIEIQKILRQYDDEIRDRKIKLEQTEEAIKTGSDLIKIVTDNTQKAELQKTLNLNLQYKNQLTEELNRIEKLKNEALSESRKIFNIQEEFRNKKILFELDQQEIQILQEKLDGYKKIEQINPLAETNKEIPLLEKTLLLKQADLELDKNILDIQEKLFNKQITEDLANQQIENYKKINLEKQKTIELTFKESEYQLKLAQTTRELNRANKEREYISQRLSNQLNAANLKLRANPLDYSAGNPLSINLLQQLTENTTNFENRKQDIKTDRSLSPRERSIALLRETLLNNSRIANIQNTYSRDLAEQQVKNLETSFQRDQQLRSFITQSEIDLLNARAGLITNVQGNPFAANALNRRSSILSEKLRYQNQLQDLEIQKNQLSLQGINIDPEKLADIRKNLEAIHKINLENINKQFKSFGETLTDVAKNAILNLSSSITNLIKGTTSLNDVLNNFFDTLLTGLLQNGLNALFGSLFGGSGFKLFYDGGLIPSYADGGLHHALNRERMKSGRNPQLAIVHENELIIPAKRVEKLTKMGLSPSILLGSYADGGVVGGISPSSMIFSANKEINIKYQIERINERNYVDEETFRIGLKQAAEAGANKGFSKMEQKINKSSSFRRNAGF